MTPTGYEIEWWYSAAVRHAEADEACGRPWQCACGPCRVGREESGLTTHYVRRCREYLSDRVRKETVMGPIEGNCPHGNYRPACKRCQSYSKEPCRKCGALRVTVDDVDVSDGIDYVIDCEACGDHYVVDGPDA